MLQFQLLLFLFLLEFIFTLAYFLNYFILFLNVNNFIYIIIPNLVLLFHYFFIRRRF